MSDATMPPEESTAPFDYENRLEPVLSRRRFLRRMTHHIGYGSIIVVASLVIGTGGFMLTGESGLVDSFLNACMLLGGMGPVGALASGTVKTPEKIFAALFALYAGLVFLILASLVFAPVFHRVLHRFHWEVKQEQ